jgi:hypothetical protein
MNNKEMVEKIIFLLENEEGESLDSVDYEEAMFYLHELKDNL